MNMSNSSCRKNITYVLLSVMALFFFYPAFAYAGTPPQLQWYISNGKDVVGTTNDAVEGKQTDSYDYTPYGRGTMLSSVASGRWSVARGPWPVAGKKQSNIQHLTQLRQGFRLRKATPGQASGQAFNINTNPFQYSGYYLDSVSGLYYLNARYYSPEFMRFISRDSYDLSNRYAYGDGEPISNIDPTGHNAWSGFSKNILGCKPLNYTLAGLAVVGGIAGAVCSAGSSVGAGWGVACGLLGAASGGTQIASMATHGQTSKILNYISMGTAVSGLFCDGYAIARGGAEAIENYAFRKMADFNDDIAESIKLGDEAAAFRENPELRYVRSCLSEKSIDKEIGRLNREYYDHLLPASNNKKLFLAQDDLRRRTLVNRNCVKFLKDRKASFDECGSLLKEGSIFAEYLSLLEGIH